MNRKIYHYALWGAVFVFTASGSFALGHFRVFENLEQAAEKELQAGDYLASLVRYGELERQSPGDKTVALRTEESKDLLIAKEILGMAQGAAEEGNWLETKALLQKSSATTNTSFKDYKQAIDLYLEAANKVKILEDKIDKELAQFKEEALLEKTQRAQAEKRARETAEELQGTRVAKEKTETALQEQIVATDQARADAELERIKKFSTELSVYVDMVARGQEHLAEALAEIDNSRDTMALILINQGKVLVAEANTKGAEFLAERTPEEYRGVVQKLLQAAGTLIDAVRSLGSAVIYIDEKNGDSFRSFYGQGKSGMSAASGLISELNAFLASLR